LKVRETKFRYAGKRFGLDGFFPTEYRDEFFQLQLDAESDLFEDLRKQNGITPWRIADASREELQQIREFFAQNRKSFFFLFEGGQFVGSILFIGNYIQSLIVMPECQRKSYGSQLTKFAVNKILEGGHGSVELHVMSGNGAAEKLYRKLGFAEVPGEG
jgi:ribosomal protein S18 acetylase RimI-like enzyme